MTQRNFIKKSILLSLSLFVLIALGHELTKGLFSYLHPWMYGYEYSYLFDLIPLLLSLIFVLCTNWFIGLFFVERKEKKWWKRYCSIFLIFFCTIFVLEGLGGVPLLLRWNLSASFVFFPFIFFVILALWPIFGYCTKTFKLEQYRYSSLGLVFFSTISLIGLVYIVPDDTRILQNALTPYIQEVDKTFYQKFSTRSLGSSRSGFYESMTAYFSSKESLPLKEPLSYEEQGELKKNGTKIYAKYFRLFNYPILTDLALQYEGENDWLLLKGDNLDRITPLIERESSSRSKKQ